MNELYTMVKRGSGREKQIDRQTDRQMVIKKRKQNIFCIPLCIGHYWSVMFCVSPFTEYMVLQAAGSSILSAVRINSPRDGSEGEGGREEGWE